MENEEIDQNQPQKRVPLGAALLAFREQSSCGQSDLAAQLGVTRSMLSMAELGQRPLPTKAVLRFQQLQQLLEAQDQELQPGTTELHGEHCRALLKHLKAQRADLKVKLATKTRMLEKTVAGYRSAQTQHSMLLALLQEREAKNKSGKRSTSAQLGKQKCERAMARHSLLKQAQLQLAITGLNAQLRHVKRELKRVRTELRS